MSDDGYTVPPVLRGYRFVPRQAPGSRAPARVTPGAFRDRGLPIPEMPGQQNVYRLTEREGLPWSPGIDRHIARRGGELLGGDALDLVDVDTPGAVDGTPMVNSFRWLSDRAYEAGVLLDLTVTLTVQTPGHPDTGHLAGWHMWFRAPEQPVRLGALARCRAIELKARGTCPGSPGYTIRHARHELPVLPAWLAALAGSPRKVTPLSAESAPVSAAGAWRRLHGILTRLLAAEQGERNRLLFWASLHTGELVAAGAVEAGAAEAALREAAADIGLVRDDGDSAVLATIRSGFERAGVTHAAR